MLGITKKKVNEDSGWHLFNAASRKNGSVLVLKQLSKNLKKELDLRLKQSSSFTGSLKLSEALQLVIDNLTNVKLAIDLTLQRDNSLLVNTALILLDGEMEKTKTILEVDQVLQSSQATEIGVRTLNLLFGTKQAIKQDAGVITPLLPIVNRNDNLIDESSSKQSSSTNAVSPIPQMIISSTVLYQLHHSLFPAERMLVGAGNKNGQNIEIDGIFDVTGRATSGSVKADADRLARALIVMSETEKHFALWIHSHPGRGKGATHPSSTDLNQEAEWLKDFSPNLVNAIVVEDRFIRFWGRALEEKRITVEITGTGIIREFKNESIYRLEF